MTLLKQRAGIVVFSLFLCISARADVIVERLPTGLLAQASWQPADPQRPALLVLHGFLQTYDFLATRNVIEGLHGLGYTVLGPNLSLGINLRKQSLQCEAPHAHTLEQDIEEIRFWVQWLRSRGYREVILVGHSWGSQHALAYRQTFDDTNVPRVIAISIVRSSLTADEIEKQLRNKPHDSEELFPFALSYCKKYMSTVEGFRQYAQWDDKRSLDALKSVRQRIPVHAILGGEDGRVDTSWIAALRERHIGIDVIEGANHFFSSTYEFDLIDALEKVLTKTDTGTDPHGK